MGSTTLDIEADKITVWNASEDRIDEALLSEVLKLADTAAGIDLVKLVPIIFPLGGQFLLDPNEFSAWAIQGPYDNTNSADLGNVGDTTPSRLAGGLSFPFDVRLKRFYAWHQNNNAEALAWGWRIIRQQKTSGGNQVTSVNFLDEVGDNGGVGPRDYQNNTNYLTDISFPESATVPAGEVIVLGVESPTAVQTNRYVRIMSGFFELERL